VIHGIGASRVIVKSHIFAKNDLNKKAITINVIKKMDGEDDTILMKKIFINLQLPDEKRKYRAFVDDLDEIEDIKAGIYGDMDITADQQKLMYGDVELTDGVVEDYGIQDSDEIELVLDFQTLRIDVFSRSRTHELIQRTTNDFPWFLNMKSGFCIKVKCRNPACETHKEHNGTSILLYGYGQFDFLVMLANGFKCRACDSSADPITCGFTKCRWFVECQQTGRDTKNIKKEGQIPENKLIEYDDVKMTNWNYLRFIVVPM
jgi:hypothetical protein